MNREPSTWNTIIALSQLLLLFVAFFTAAFTALAAAVWAPIAVVRGLWRLARAAACRAQVKRLDRVERRDADADCQEELPTPYLVAERLARYTALAWRTPKSY